MSPSLPTRPARASLRKKNNMVCRWRISGRVSGIWVIHTDPQVTLRGQDVNRGPAAGNRVTFLWPLNLLHTKLAFLFFFVHHLKLGRHSRSWNNIVWEVLDFYKDVKSEAAEYQLSFSSERKLQTSENIIFHFKTCDWFDSIPLVYMRETLNFRVCKLFL